MDSDEYEILSNDTHRIGLIICLAEFDADGKPSRLTPVVHDIGEKIDDGHVVAQVLFDEPLQQPDVYRYVANMLRPLADDCEEEADEQEGKR